MLRGTSLQYKLTVYIYMVESLANFFSFYLLYNETGQINWKLNRLAILVNILYSLFASELINLFNVFFLML